MAAVVTTTSLSLSSDALFSNLHVPDAVYLRPRPLASCAGVLILLPLLPKKAPLKDLPSEVWSRVFSFLLYDNGGEESATGVTSGRKALALDLASVCKHFKACVYLSFSRSPSPAHQDSLHSAYCVFWYLFVQSVQSY
jgi:hypothetical protein